MMKTLARMWPFLSPHRQRFAMAQMAMLVATATGLAFPWAVRLVFDRLLAETNLSFLLVAVGVLALVAAARELAECIKSYNLEFIGQRILRDLRDRLYARLLELSLDYYDTRSSGEVASYMSNDLQLVQQGLSSGLVYVLQQVISLLAVVVLLLRIDLVLAATILGIVPLIVWISRDLGGRVRDVAQRVQERLASLMSTIHESLAGMDIIQAFVLRRHALDLFRAQNDQVFAHTLHNIRITSRARLTIGLLNALFVLITIGLGGYRVHSGYLTLPDLIAFILYSEMIVGPIGMLAGLYVELNKAAAAFDRVWGVLAAQPTVVEPSHPVRLAQPGSEIVFERVSFSYREGEEVLQEISFGVASGEMVALVGPSGAGKSTLVKLLPRFYDPDEGRILLQGVDIREMAVDDLRGQIAIVPQDTYLFGFSIEENIACGRPEATREEIVSAAQLANAHEFIVNLEHGYQTQVGERGARLSGGQRQRIAIARAFLRNPRILILDEATSALDTLAEQKVQDALARLMHGRTTFVIAHRLSTIRHADRILVLKDGRILASGRHEELLRTCAFYADLYHRQFTPAMMPPPALI